jgi:hypothetical protein
MKKITLLFFAFFTAALSYAQSASNYCSTEVFLNGNSAEANTVIKLTIVKTGAATMKITAADPNILDMFFDPPTDFPTSVKDVSVSGEISYTLTWAPAAPTTVVFPAILWSKSNAPGTSIIRSVSTLFDVFCAPPPTPGEDVSLSDLKLDGVIIAGFSSSKTIYNIEVPLGGSTPIVTNVTLTNTNAALGAITQASAVPGSATFNVTSVDATVSQTYTINFIQLFPTTAAQTPPARNAVDVVSIFSDAYQTSAINPINYDAGWCNGNNPGAVTATTAGGNAIFAYNDKSCQGMVFPDDLQDLTGFTHIHIDLFVKAGTDLVGKIFNMFTVPVSGANSPFNIDINGLSPALVPGTWYSYDMPVTFSGPTVNIKEFGVVSNMLNTVWYDNLYFYKGTALSNKDFEIAGLNVYPNPARDSWTVKTQNINMSSIQVFDVLGKNVLSFKPNASEVTIDGSSLKSGLYFARINTLNGSSSLKLIKN